MSKVLGTTPRAPRAIFAARDALVAVMADGTHLVFFLHGVDGRPREFNLMTRAFKEKLPSTVKLHVCTSFHGITHRGGAAAAKAVAAELSTVIERTRCDRLSVVCHSYGGVVMAYALHLLGSTLDGVSLLNYIALATPFLGIRGSLLGTTGLNILPLAATRPIAKRLSTTVMELTLEDEHTDEPSSAATVTAASSSSPPQPPQPQRPQPFLRRVSRPDVLHILNRFDRRVLYSNIHGDLSVGYESAALLPSKPNAFTRSVEWPHVTAESACGKRHHQAVPRSAGNGDSAAYYDDGQEVEVEVEALPDESPWLRRDARRHTIRSILRSYWTLSWERYDVSIGFGSALLASPLAHEQIMGKRFGGAMEDRRGKDVIDHLISGFRVHGREGRAEGEAVAITMPSVCDRFPHADPTRFSTIIQAVQAAANESPIRSSAAFKLLLQQWCEVGDWPTSTTCSRPTTICASRSSPTSRSQLLHVGSIL